MCLIVPLSIQYTRIFGLNEFQIGLTYIANGAGNVLGSYANGWMLDKVYTRDKKALAPGEHINIEKTRLKLALFPLTLVICSVIPYGWILQFKPLLYAALVLQFTLVGCKSFCSMDKMEMLINLDSRRVLE